MSRKILIKRILTLSLALIVMAASTVMAAGKGRLELLLGYENVTLSLYRVGDYRVEAGSRIAELADAYKDSGAQLDRLWKDAAEMRRQAQLLDTYIARHGSAAERTMEVKPYTDGTNQISGQVVSEDIEEGVYLIRKTGGDPHVEVTPFLITMPYLDEESQTWTYNIKAYPKCGHDDGDDDDDDDDDDEGPGGDRPGGDRPGGDRPGGDGPGTPPDGTTTIDEGDVPLASWIPDDPVPLAGLPKMGDPGMIGYLLGALAAAAAGGAAFWRRGKCSTDEDE